MADTQLDRIENMLKMSLRTTSSIAMDGTDKEATELRDKIEKYKIKKQD